jgi:hypothetical protein
MFLLDPMKICGPCTKHKYDDYPNFGIQDTVGKTVVQCLITNIYCASKKIQSKGKSKRYEGTLPDRFIGKWSQPPICILVSKCKDSLSHALSNII